MLDTDEIYDDLVKYLSKPEDKNIETCYGFIKIAERMAWLRRYFTNKKNVTTTAMIKVILERSRLLLDVLNPASYAKGLKS